MDTKLARTDELDYFGEDGDAGPATISGVLAHATLAACTFPLVVAVDPTVGVGDNVVLVSRDDGRIRNVLVGRGFLVTFWGLAGATAGRVSSSGCTQHAGGGARVIRGLLVLWGRLFDPEQTVVALLSDDDTPFWFFPSPSCHALCSAVFADGNKGGGGGREGKGGRRGEGELRGAAPGGAFPREECGSPVEADPPALVLVDGEEEAERWGRARGRRVIVWM